MKTAVNIPLAQSYLERYQMTDVFSEELIHRMVLSTFERGESIAPLNEPLEAFHLLVEGKLKVYSLQENGKKVLIRFYRPMSVIGDLEFLSDYPVKAVVEALEPSMLITIPMEILRAHTLECPKFLRFVIANLSQKLFTWSNMAGLNLVYPLENRVASYLVSISELSDENRLDEIRVTSLEEMADLLCSSYRHLHRILEAFESAGIISRTRSNIRILDFEKLKSLAVGIFE